MRKIATLGALMALGMSGAAFGAEGVSHSFVEAGYGYSEFGGGSVADGDGFKVGGSLELPANFVVGANYRDFSIDGLELAELSAGVGYKWALASSFDLVTGASFEQIDGGGDKVSGFALNAGVRGRITEKLELDAGLKYQDMESDSGMPTFFAASMGFRYYFNPAFAGGVEVRKTDALLFAETSLIATLRYDFGKLF